jgi:hypothetical protein
MAGGGDERGSSGGGNAISVAACSSSARAVATGDGGGRDERCEEDADAGAEGTSLADRREGAELGEDLAGSLGRDEPSRDDAAGDGARDGAGSA